jgi:hypothetical protein
MLDLIGVAMVIVGGLSCLVGVLAVLPRKRRSLLLYFLAAPLPWMLPLVMVGQAVSWLTRAIVRLGRPGL